MDCDICIIGGGASGLAAAVTAAEKASVTVLERKNQPGRKIAASGNGKCNLTNVKAQGYEQVREFFQGLGVFIRQDGEGRCYPRSENSGDVVKALTRQAESLGVKMCTGYKVEKIEKKKDCFFISGTKDVGGRKKERYSITAGKLLIAAGGKSMAELGTRGDGAAFAKDLGHRVTRLVPVLTAVETREKPEKAGYRGVRAKAQVSLNFKGEEIFAEYGEVQFTEDGISGICVFNLSRYMMIPEGKNFKNGFDDYKVVIDFLPEMERDEAVKAVETGAMAFHQRMRRMGKTSCRIRMAASEILLSFVRDGLAEEMGRRIEKTAGKEHMAMEDIGSIVDLIVQQLKCFYMQPSGARGWNFAQVTKGGVVLDEIDMSTMESKKVQNLFFAGEVIDYDGPCGGFNLQNAWLTGIRSGKAMADGCNREKRKK